MSKIKDWLNRYIAIHTATYSHDWPEPGTKDFSVLKQLFQIGFAEHNISEELAIRSLIRIKSDPPRFREQHLEKVLKAAEAIRREDKAKSREIQAKVRTPEEIEAARLSADCPECRGSGIATRRARTQMLPVALPIGLLCRCELGRFRGLSGEESDKFYLQAHPYLWHLDLDHPTWSWVPLRPDLDVDPEYKKTWWFVGHEPENVESITDEHDTSVPRRRRKHETPERREPTMEEVQAAERRRAALLTSLLRKSN